MRLALVAAMQLLPPRQRAILVLRMCWNLQAEQLLARGPDHRNGQPEETILPEFQQLEIGQVIGEEGFAVRDLEPGRHLVLAFHYPKTQWVVKQGVWPKFGHCSMCLQLKPAQDGERTRLLYRVRISAPPLGRALMLALFEPADFVQSRKMLTGIKRRAETHYPGTFASQAHKTETGGRAR